MEFKTTKARRYCRKRRFNDNLSELYDDISSLSAGQPAYQPNNIGICLSSEIQNFRLFNVFIRGDITEVGYINAKLVILFFSCCSDARKLLSCGNVN